MLSIINQTLDILHANPEWHRRYAGYLADIWANCDKIKKGFVKPQGLSIYIFPYKTLSTNEDTSSF